MGRLSNIFLLCLIFMLCCDLNFNNDFECGSDKFKTVAAFSFLNLTNFPSFYSKIVAGVMKVIHILYLRVGCILYLIEIFLKADILYFLCTFHFMSCCNELIAGRAIGFIFWNCTVLLCL